MNTTKTAYLLLFLAILSGSWWQTARGAQPSKLGVAGYSISIYKSSIVISHSAAPGVYNTILPYDESVIFGDGSMQKIRTPDADIHIDQQNNFLTAKINQTKNWLNSILCNQLTAQVINKNGYKVTYRAKDRENKIEIERTIKAPQNNKKTMIGVEEALIYDPQSYLLVDDERINNPEQENIKVIIENATNLKIVHPQTPETLKLNIEQASNVLIDFEYHLITIQKYTEPSAETIKDKQTIEVVPFDQKCNLKK